MSLPERVKSILSAMGRPALKLRGQHFLVDETVLDRIIETSGVKRGNRVLEIGPGLGFLTERLVAHGCEVAVIELDPGFADHIERELGDRVLLTRGDALDVDLQKVFDGKPYHIVANIPYGISSKLLERIVGSASYIESATLLVQKEVAERVSAGKGEMNMLALIVGSRFDAKIGFGVPPGAFLPPPKVQSAVLKLVRHGRETGDLGAIITVAKKAFLEPRKKIANTLGIAKATFEKLGMTGDERPSTLSLDQWRALSGK
jgi:16S rRNA (adenine1518-N6/adenine1519-N6)-dimethyltransferase